MRPPTVTLWAVLLVLLASLAVPAAGADPPPGRSVSTARLPQILGLRAYTLSPQKYAGDRRLFVTISPNGDRVRDMAKIGFTLTERATVRLRIARTLSRPDDRLRGDGDTSGRADTPSTGPRSRRSRRAPT